MDNSPLHQFNVVVRVVLEKPIASIDSSEVEKLTGYYVNVGVAARDKTEAMRIISDAFNDGRIDWAESEWKSLETVDPSITAKAKSFHGSGIWYKSGRAFFPDTKA